MLDTNENIELECEIRIPDFILNYRNYLKNNENDKEESDLGLDDILEEGNDNDSLDSNFEEEEKIAINKSLKRKVSYLNQDNNVSGNSKNNLSNFSNFNNKFSTNINNNKNKESEFKKKNIINYMNMISDI